MDRPLAQRVEVVVSGRTLLVLLGVGAIVALVRGVDPRRLLLADRQRRDLARGRDRRRSLGVGLRLPFPIVLAVITGFLDLIPQVGATIAAIILVAVALTVSTPAALGMLVIQLISVPFAAVIKIVLREAGAPRRARMAAMRDR